MSAQVFSSSKNQSKLHHRAVFTAKLNILFIMKFVIPLIITVSIIKAENAKGYHEAIGIPIAEYFRSSAARVAGGYLALNEYQFPYAVGLLVSLPQNKISVCSASMLSNAKLLTAAHCWNDGNQQAIRLTAVFGTTNLLYGGVRVDSNSVAVNPGYNAATSLHDIAVITTPYVYYSPSISKVKLPPMNPMDCNFIQGTITGYGIRDPNEVGSSNRSLNFRTVSLRDFGLTSDTIYTYSANQVYPEIIAACSGDDGAPLVTTCKGINVVIGVASSVRRCFEGNPSLFEKVSYYLEWILEQMGTTPAEYYDETYDNAIKKRYN